MFESAEKLLPAPTSPTRWATQVVLLIMLGSMPMVLYRPPPPTRLVFPLPIFDRELLCVSALTAAADGPPFDNPPVIEANMLMTRDELRILPELVKFFARLGEALEPLNPMCDTDKAYNARSMGAAKLATLGGWKVSPRILDMVGTIKEVTAMFHRRSHRGR